VRSKNCRFEWIRMRVDTDPRSKWIQIRIDLDMSRSGSATVTNGFQMLKPDAVTKLKTENNNDLLRSS